MTGLRIIAYGIPAPQGSKRFVGVRGGKGVMVESSAKVKPWREVVHAAAVAARAGAAPIDGPVLVRMVFTMPKPASAPKTRRTYPCRQPDLSKLCRSTEDALTTAGVWVDDSRVVGYRRLEKVYPGEDPESLEAPGVRIEVTAICAGTRVGAHSQMLGGWVPLLTSSGVPDNAVRADIVRIARAQVGA